MKKNKLLWGIAFLAIAILILNSAKTLSSDILNSNPKEIIEEKTGINPDNPSQSIEDIKTDYLKKEWGAVIEKNKYLGLPYRLFNEAMNFLSPAFKIILGVEYSLSWTFIFAIAIWLMFFFILKPISSELLKSYWQGALTAAIIPSLIGLLGIIAEISETLSIIIKNVWIAWISLLISIAIAIVLSKLGKDIAKTIKKREKEEKEKQTEEDMKLFHKHFNKYSNLGADI